MSLPKPNGQAGFPQWLDRKEYPFESRFLNLPAGKMHFIDVGEGDPIVFVHATPGWSFEYRVIIKELSKTNRCIAFDNLGFGLSDKPFNYDYKAQSHAQNFKALMEWLKLEKITLVVHDWGGPYALSYAIENPSKFKKLVILNSMLFSVINAKQVNQMVKVVGSKLGWFLVTNFNFFAKTMFKKLIVNKANSTNSIHQQLYKPLATKQDRKASWVAPRELKDADDWLKKLWLLREKINNIPTTFIWGMKSIAMKEEQLNTWIAGWHNPKVIKVENAGHFPHIDAPEVIINELKTN